MREQLRRNNGSGGRRAENGRISRPIVSVIATAIACLLLSFPVSADVGQYPVELPPIDQVVCASYFVYDITKDEVVLEMEPDKRIFPASMTKIMTVALALEHLDTDTIVTVSKTAMDATTPNSTMMGLKVDEQVLVSELLFGAMLPSGNDAANVLGEAVASKVLEEKSVASPADGGNSKSLIEVFVDIMNEKVTELGLVNTHFMNTNGLHHDEHYTTASDLSVIFRYALSFEDFRTIINSPSHAFKATNIHPFDGWSISRNTNYLLADPWIVGPESKVAQIVGGKTGTTIPAGTGMTLLSVTKNGDELITVVCGIPYDSANRQTTYVATILNAGAKICFDADPVVRVEGNVMNNRPYNAPVGQGPESPVPTDTPEPTESAVASETSATAETTQGSSVQKPSEEGSLNWVEYLRENMVVAILAVLVLVFIVAIILLVIIPSIVRRKRRKKRSSGFQGIRRI